MEPMRWSESELFYDDLIEPALIGAVLMAPIHLQDAARLVSPDDFSNVRCRVAWKELLRMAESGLAPDTVTLTHHLKPLPEFRDMEAGVNGWIIRVLNACEWSFNAPSYARVIRQESLKRRALVSAENVRSRLAAGEQVDVVIGEHNSEVERLESELHSAPPPTTRESLDEFWHELDLRAERGVMLAGLPTGFPALDDMTGGLQAGYHLVGARPGVGKTAFLCNVALNLLGAGKRVLFVSLEMTTDQIIQRFYSSTTRVPLTSIIAAGKLEREQYKALLEAHGNLFNIAGDRLTIVTPERQRMTPAVLSGIVAKAQRKGVDAVFVDYLGLMAGNDRYKTRYEEVTSISAGLLNIAMDLRLPLVVASQLNRRSTERADRKPDLSDLRESGALEQDAHTVAMLWRPESDVEGYDPHMAELALVKNRFGPTGNVALYWDGPVVRFQPARMTAVDLRTAGGRS